MKRHQFLLDAQIFDEKLAIVRISLKFCANGCANRDFFEWFFAMCHSTTKKIVWWGVFVWCARNQCSSLRYNVRLLLLLQLHIFDEKLAIVRIAAKLCENGCANRDYWHSLFLTCHTKKLYFCHVGQWVWNQNSSWRRKPIVTVADFQGLDRVCGNLSVVRAYFFAPMSSC